MAKGSNGCVCRLTRISSAIIRTPSFVGAATSSEVQPSPIQKRPSQWLACRRKPPSQFLPQFRTAPVQGSAHAYRLQGRERMAEKAWHNKVVEVVLQLPSLCLIGMLHSPASLAHLLRF